MKTADNDNFYEFVNIIHTLRKPGGCPWDREQTPATIKNYLIEECYELVDALETNDISEIKEELGDLLLQIVFLADYYAEAGHFTIETVISHITQKMVVRHPHVFSDVKVSNVNEVLTNWENIKSLEKGKIKRKSILDGIPKSIPPLAKSLLLQKKASRVGFDWPDYNGALQKVQEEIDELKKKTGEKHSAAEEEELGDLFFSLINYARKRGLDPERALEHCNRKFISRFKYIEENKTKDWSECKLSELEELWQKSKRNQPLSLQQFDT